MEPDCHGGSGTRSQTSFNYGPKQALTDGQVTLQEFVVMLNIEHFKYSITHVKQPSVYFLKTKKMAKSTFNISFFFQETSS